MFETHGVHFDPALRDEVVARVDHLKLPSYTGFVMPKLEAVTGPVGRDRGRRRFRIRATLPGRCSSIRPQRGRSGSECFRPGRPEISRANRLADALTAARAGGRTILDLTESNPTRAGFEYPDDLLRPLADSRGLTYAPAPFGLPDARAAVARDFARRGLSVTPERIALTASTSEAYGCLFKLLADAGDEVLVPRPSYPLFDHLARLELVTARPYDLDPDGGWRIDFDSLENALTPRTRAILLVSPNNPTGSFVTADELERIAALCASPRARR